jgi:WD40 repeat protein
VSASGASSAVTPAKRRPARVTGPGGPGASAVRRVVRALLPLATLGLVASAVGCGDRTGPAPSPVAAASPSRAGPVASGHEHAPRHGGAVGVAGDLYLEAVLEPQGVLRVYLTDAAGAAVPLDGVQATVHVASPEDDVGLPLRAAGGSLVARGAPFAADRVDARFELVVRGAPAQIGLSLQRGGEGAPSGVEPSGCEPLPSPSGASHEPVPRCVLRFHRGIAALASSPDGATLVVAAADAAVSTWHVPRGALAFGFVPPPGPPPSAAERVAAQRGAPNALAVRPDGESAVVALEDRLLIYSMADGRLLRELPRHGGFVRDVAWSAHGAALLVSWARDAKARLLRADDGLLLAEMPVAEEAGAVAMSADGRFAAVASEKGGVVEFAPRTAERLRFVGTAGAVSRVLSFGLLQQRLALIGGGADGVVRAWNPESGETRWEASLGSPVVRIAVAPGGDALAVSGADGSVALLTASGGIVARLEGRGGGVNGLAIAGDTLASGDGSGQVLLWDLAPLLHRARQP